MLVAKRSESKSSLKPHCVNPKLTKEDKKMKQNRERGLRCNERSNAIEATQESNTSIREEDQ